jgi:hypothetical protein
LAVAIVVYAGILVEFVPESLEYDISTIVEDEALRTVRMLESTEVTKPVSAKVENSDIPVNLKEKADAD